MAAFGAAGPAGGGGQGRARLHRPRLPLGSPPAARPRNLDAWICGAEAIAPLAGRAGAGCDLLIVEGVMGLFDGAGDGSPASTADVAGCSTPL